MAIIILRGILGLNSSESSPLWSGRHISTVRPENDMSFLYATMHMYYELAYAYPCFKYSKNDRFSAGMRKTSRIQKSKDDTMKRG